MYVHTYVHEDITPSKLKKISVPVRNSTVPYHNLSILSVLLNTSSFPRSRCYFFGMNFDFLNIIDTLVHKYLIGRISTLKHFMIILILPNHVLGNTFLVLLKSDRSQLDRLRLPINILCPLIFMTQEVPDHEWGYLKQYLLRDLPIDNILLQIIHLQIQSPGSSTCSA